MSWLKLNFEMKINRTVNKSQRLHKKLIIIIIVYVNFLQSLQKMNKNGNSEQLSTIYAKLNLPLVVLSAFSFALISISSLQGKSISNPTSSSVLCYLKGLEILITA
jgi:hypothetical protein